MSRIRALSLVLLLAPAWAIASQPIAGPVRLVLRSGATYDVPGSIQTQDGHWVFRDSRGRLLSLDPALVQDVVPAASRRAAATPPRAPSASDRSTPGFEGALRYTNADLPPPTAEAEEEETPPEPSETEPVDPAAADSAPVEPTAAEPPAAPPEEPPPAPVSFPRMVDGHDEAWWRQRVAERREEIAALEQQEHVAHRKLICAQHGVIGGAGCDPLLRAKPNWFASTPAENALVDELRTTRSRLEERREDLAEFLDQAFGLGVPTGWLL